MRTLSLVIVLSFIDIELLTAFVLLGIAFVLQVWAYLRLKRKNQLIRQQSESIQRQVEELQRVNAELEKLNAEKTRLLALVSHDLKGPFNRTIALVNLLQLTHTLPPEQKEYVDKIQHIAADGLAMVRNLLEKRKMEARGIPFFPESIDYSAWIRQFIRTYQIAADKKNISLQLQTEEGIVGEADRTHLNRMAENILSNAVKFSPRGTTVFVSLAKEADNVVLRVRDEGPGISAEDQQKLYGNFQRLSARPTAGETSTGLGLSIVKDLLDQMKGSIACDSTLGEGTTFIIRFPAHLELPPES